MGNKKLKGFTLVEIVVAIAIIAIMVSLALPQYSKAKLSAVVSSHNSNVQTIKSAAIMADIDDDSSNDLTSRVADFLEGNELPEIPSEVPGASGGWKISKDDKKNIIVEPGLMELVNGEIKPKK